MYTIKRSMQQLGLAAISAHKSAGSDVNPCIGEKYPFRQIDWVASRGSLVLTKDHPKIVECIQSPLKPVCKLLPELSAAFTRLTGFHKVLVTDFGIHAYYLALRFAAQWGIAKKNIPFHKAVILATPSSFLGGCLPWNLQTWPEVKIIAFNNLSALESELWTNNHVCGLLMDTIQWSDSVEEPGHGYLMEVRRTCDKHNVLWLADETSCGLGRTGHVMAYMMQNCQPDVVILASTLGCGLYKTGVLLTTDEIFTNSCQDLIESLKSKDSLIVAIALEAMKAFENESLADNAAVMGEYLREALKLAFSPEEIPQILGRGLLTSIRIHGGIGKATEVCDLMRERGVSVWKSSEQHVGITPPLHTDAEQIVKGVKILASVIDSLFEKHIDR